MTCDLEKGGKCYLLLYKLSLHTTKTCRNKASTSIYRLFMHRRKMFPQKVGKGRKGAHTGQAN